MAEEFDQADKTEEPSTYRIEEFRRAGLNCREVVKDIPLGVDKVRELFKSNRLHILSSCVNFLDELESYRYPDRPDVGNEKEVPVKEHDHLLDCLRYALFSNEPQSGIISEDFRLYSSTYD